MDIGATEPINAGTQCAKYASKIAPGCLYFHNLLLLITLLGLKPHVCNDYGRAFAEKFKLQKHVNAVHKGALARPTVS